MISFRKNVDRNSLLVVLPLTVFWLISVLSSAAGAADYYIWGRVYCASPFTVTEGEDPPVNPLTGVPPEQIIGEDMIAVIPRNLVKVRVLKASDGSELGSHIVTNDGGYLVSFNVAGSSIPVQIIVEELATNQRLLMSDPVDLSSWPTPNIRFVLILEDLTEISRDREFVLSATGIHTGIFTRVGKIELETEVGGTTHRLIDTGTGCVTVPAPVSSDLDIPEYQNAPLGGNLFIFGAFDEPLYGPSAHYRVKIENLDTGTETYMSSELVKTKYTVDLTSVPINVTTERVTLGPEPVGVYTNCYKMTPLSTSVGGVHIFWSFPDQVALWETGGLNGNYQLTLESVPPGSFVPVPDFTVLTVFLDNIRPEAKILPLDVTDYDTPRVYTPGPPVPGSDLLNTLLGNFPVHYGGTGDPVCLILNLEGTTGSKYLAFNLTAYHTNGFLRYWDFRYQRNDGNNEILMGKQYDGTTDSMVDYFTGIRIPTSTQTDVTGFQNKYLYLDTDHLQPQSVSTPLGGCAYRFVIRASTRTTDGYHYLRYAWDQDLHYLQR